eukprot:jgi/Astpho2/1524/Aster-x1010
MRPSVLVQVDKMDGLDVGDACEVKPTNKLLKHDVNKGGDFKPHFHIFCDSTALSRTAASSFKDGLPKYAETPKEMGGSGKLFES